MNQVHDPAAELVAAYAQGLQALLDKNWDVAASCFLSVVQSEPLDPDSYCKYGQALWGQGHKDYALSVLREAVMLGPSNSEAQACYGTSLQARGFHLESIAHLEKALVMANETPLCHWALAHALLALGELSAGLEHYRYGFCIGARKPRTLLPTYTGSEPSVLLWSEQGAGDQLFYARFGIDFAALMPCRTIFEVHQPLYRLMRSQRYDERAPSWCGKLTVAPMQTDGSIPWGTECALPVLESPLWMRPYEEPATPWLIAPGIKSYPSAEKQVGIVWRGTPTYCSDKERSLALEDFEPIVKALQASGYKVVSCQVPCSEAEIETLNAWGVEDWGQTFQDWADTADALSVLDHLVTVSTGCSVLAGALGVPSKVLVPDPGDWRWYTKGEKKDTAFWIPEARLFWQHEKEQWAGAIADLIGSYTNDADIYRVADSESRRIECADERGVHDDIDTNGVELCLRNGKDSGAGRVRETQDAP